MSTTLYNRSANGSIACTLLWFIPEPLSMFPANRMSTRRNLHNKAYWQMLQGYDDTLWCWGDDSFLRTRTLCYRLYVQHHTFQSCLLILRPDGLGPLIFASMSEIPILGRRVAYLVTFTLYLCFSPGAALVDNIGGLMFFRFLQSFFGSPCLANGGAIMQDMVSFICSFT
jgi:hypothetical protein